MMPRGIRRFIFTHNKVNVLALKVLPGSRLDALRHWAFQFAQQQIQAQGDAEAALVDGGKEGAAKGLAYRRFRLHLCRQYE